VTTIETLCPFARLAGGIDLVQMGQAYITARHHIQADDGWMTARQAADRGHGTLLIDHIYPKFYSLRHMGGGNIIINTFATPDTTPTQIEAATMGYHFDPPADPLHNSSPTYPLQEAEGRSYCHVTQCHLKGMSGREPHNQHLWLPRQLRNWSHKLSTRGLTGSTRANPILGLWVSKPNWIPGQGSDRRKSMVAISIQF